MMRPLLPLAILLTVVLTACACRSAAPTDDAAAKAGDTVTAVRGVWVPSPRFTDVLHTRQGVSRFVQSLDDLHMNAIFLVAYAETKTIYRSRTLTSHSTYATPDEGWLLADYAAQYHSDTGDPVRDLIDEAHRRGIRVFFWYEYGFMGQGRPIAADNPLLAANPQWLGIAHDGTPANYNGSDYYFNAYDPQVQEFLLNLVEEGLRLYPDVDGIQGDDRMPAMPRDSGYDDCTTALYRSEHGGNEPPASPDDPQWVQWRVDILNAFARTLHDRVRAINPKAMVSFAPNPYPWCEQKLMQQWPQWCRDGACHLLTVQCYRYSADAYRATVAEVARRLGQCRPGQLFAPGMILTEGANSKMTPALLEQQLQINRQLGTAGEVFFYNRGLDNPGVREVLKRFYRSRARFPGL